MTCLDNYRTHYCPDSDFSLISENDIEFETCNCFRAVVDQSPVTSFGEAEADLVQSSPLVAEQIWYRTIAALAKACGIGKPIQTEPISVHKDEEVPVTVRKA